MPPHFLCAHPWCPERLSFLSLCGWGRYITTAVIVSVWEGIEEIQYTEACPESSPSSALAFLKFPLFTNQLMRKSWVNCLIMKWLTHFYNKLSFQSLHWLIMWNQWKSASESPDLWFTVNLLRNLLKNDFFFYVWSSIYLGDYMYTTSMQRPAKARGHQIP